MGTSIVMLPGSGVHLTGPLPGTALGTLARHHPIPTCAPTASAAARAPLTATPERESTVRVVEVSAYGGPEVLRLSERPDPEPEPGRVRVRMTATTVNQVDLRIRSGAAAGRLGYSNDDEPTTATSPARHRTAPPAGSSVQDDSHQTNDESPTQVNLSVGSWPGRLDHR